MSRDRLGLVLLVVGCAAVPAQAQDEYRHGRVRHLEYGVTVQRASESTAEEATFNDPFLPGDRVWTDASGRVEFQFADGSLLRLDNRSKLDYTAHEDGKIVLRLWSGGAFLRTRDARSEEFEFETPGAFVNSRGEGLIRVDVQAGETRLAVLEGRADLESGRRRLQVAAGERAYGRRGEAPTDESDERLASDDFDRWNESRDERGSRASASSRYLPEEVSPFADDFESNGSWYYETEIGYVWRPMVASGWRPYTSGRWSWTSYGWTWVPNESWGWAPFHYGRWGHSTAIGWYWIPGSTWGPAWVSWAMGSNYVGWCPLGYRDRVYSFDNRRGNSGPRRSGDDHWNFARRADLGARDLAQRRIAVRPEEAREIRVADSPHVRPSRDVASLENRPVQDTARARTRTIQTKHTPGDTVPELRSDPFTTIPAPVARRRSNKDENGRERDHQDNRRYDSDAHSSAPADATATRTPRHTSPDEPAATTGRPRGQGGSEESHSPAVRTPEPERATERVRTERSTPRDRDASRERSRSEAEAQPHPSREIMRDFFSPVNRRSDGDSGGSARSRGDRDEPRREAAPRDDSRATPRHSAPPPPPRAETAKPAPRPAGEHGNRRPKDKDQH